MGRDFVVEVTALCQTFLGSMGCFLSKWGQGRVASLSAQVQGVEGFSAAG